MASIFSALDKHQRAAADGLADFSFEDRADLLNDLLEEDTSCFPLLAVPGEVLSTVLLLSDVAVALRIRPLCCQMRSAIDGDTGLWCSLILRDFADMGGRTKHYQGLQTLADAGDDAAFTRLEWDPLMICAAPALRYSLLAASQARMRMWADIGPTLSAAWSWFSSKVCRRMAVSTFLRWGALQHDEAALRRMLGPGLGGEPPAAAEAAAGSAPGEEPADEASASASSGQGMRFRVGRSDSVSLNAAAVTDIYETVQRWHNKAHTDMMRAHFGKQEQPSGGGGAGGSAGAGAGQDVPSSGCGFSVTPTLDAAEAAFFAAEAEVASAAAPEAAARGRGEASRRLEEAQLRLALELSSKEAEKGAEEPAAAAGEEPAKAEPEPPPARPEPACLKLRADGVGGPAPVVFLKPHCLAERVQQLPEGHERSVEHVVHKLTKPSTWALLYESLTEELGFRAKSAAHVLVSAHARAVDGLLREDISLKQERVCLPIFRSSRATVTSLSRLRAADAPPEVRAARRALLRQAALEWCELEDLTEFLDAHLGSLELAIDNFRGESMSTKAHTPHVRDVGRLMFRNFCLLDSRVFKAVCLAVYGLVQEVCATREGEADSRGELLELLESVHAMLASCDVADDDCSRGKQTKDAFVEHLVQPVSAAINFLTDDPEPRAPGRRRGL